MARSCALVTQVWRVLARPVMRRALALAIAVAIPAFVLSAGNGLRAADVIAWSHRSALVRCGLWAGWLVLSGPVLRIAFVAPGSVSLRALRLPQTPLLLSLITLCAAVELPWLALFARGASPIETWSALTGAISISALSISARARPRGSALALLALLTLILACDPPALVGAVSSTLALPIALHAAQRDALEQPALRFKLTRPSVALTALYTFHLLRLLRVERSRLSSAFGAVAVGSAGLLLSLRNEPSERSLPRVLAVLALPLTVAAAVSVAPLLDNERRLQALLRSLRVRQSSIILAFLLAVATPSSALAAASSVVVSAGAPLGISASCGALFTWALALAGAVGLWGRYLEQRSQRSAGTFVAGVTLIALLATAGAYGW